MPTSTIELPSNFVSNLIDQVTGLLSNFSPYIVLIVSVLLIAIVIDIIVGALRHK